MSRTFSKVLGVVLLLIGLLGFAQPNLLGMHLTPIHNVIHLASGALALYFGFASVSATRAFLQAFGIVYLLLAVLGFAAPAVLARVLGHDMSMSAAELRPDNLVHVALGVVSLAFGVMRERVTARPV